MNLSDFPGVPSGFFAVRVGCSITYEVAYSAPMLVMVQLHPVTTQIVLAEKFAIGEKEDIGERVDANGNRVSNAVLSPGRTCISYDAIVMVPKALDNLVVDHSPCLDRAALPLDVLRYTLPSRYCESDKLGVTASTMFGHCLPGIETAQAICDWTHRHLEYRYGSGDPTLSACDAIDRGYGVCRDFAHVMVALCRALALPARYAAGYVPLLEATDTDIGVDFHAYVEVFIEGTWHVFDPRHNKLHMGRIKIAHGVDATEVAFATIYGAADTKNFKVWSYPVDTATVRIGDPVVMPVFHHAAPLIGLP